MIQSDEIEHYLLRFDGGATPNPGRGCGAAVLYSPTGDVLGETYESYAHATNNYAEYQGLIMGLEMALQHHVKHLRVEGDSMLVIQQAQGTWKVHVDALKPLCSSVQRLLREFTAVSLHWIPREQNAHADALTRR
jgi:probable phosphoglycerate mutase